MAIKIDWKIISWKWLKKSKSVEAKKTIVGEKIWLIGNEDDLFRLYKWEITKDLWDEVEVLIKSEYLPDWITLPFKDIINKKRIRYEK